MKKFKIALVVALGCCCLSGLAGGASSSATEAGRERRTFMDAKVAAKARWKPLFALYPSRDPRPEAKDLGDTYLAYVHRLTVTEIEGKIDNQSRRRKAFTDWRSARTRSMAELRRETRNWVLYWKGGYGPVADCELLPDIVRDLAARTGIEVCTVESEAAILAGFRYAGTDCEPLWNDGDRTEFA